MTYFLCVIGAVLAVIGDFLFKLWADMPTHPLEILVSGAVIYTFDALVWALILRRGISLSTSAVLWSSTSLIGAFMVGVLSFHENPTPLRWVGLAFGLVAVLLVSL